MSEKVKFHCTPTKGFKCHYKLHPAAMRPRPWTGSVCHRIHSKDTNLQICELDKNIEIYTPNIYAPNPFEQLTQPYEDEAQF